MIDQHNLEKRIKIVEALIEHNEKSLAQHRDSLSYLQQLLWERDSQFKRGQRVVPYDNETFGDREYVVIGYAGVDLYALDNEDDPFVGNYVEGEYVVLSESSQAQNND